MPEMSDDQREQVLSALRRGQKLEAIKLYRDATGAGLLDAKNFIEALSDQLREQDPTTYAALGKTGCGANLLWAVLAWPLIRAVWG